MIFSVSIYFREDVYPLDRGRNKIISCSNLIQLQCINTNKEQSLDLKNKSFEIL